MLVRRIELNGGEHFTPPWEVSPESGPRGGAAVFHGYGSVKESMPITGVVACRIEFRWCYHGSTIKGMARVVKKSISVPDVIWTAAEEEAANGHTTVSALITEALENLLAIRDGLRAVQEWQREHGEFTEDELAEADAILDSHGVGRNQ